MRPYYLGMAEKAIKNRILSMMKSYFLCIDEKKNKVICVPPPLYDAKKHYKICKLTSRDIEEGLLTKKWQSVENILIMYVKVNGELNEN